MINELMYYTTDSDSHPTRDDIVDKINEIIRYLNDKENENKPKKNNHIFDKSDIKEEK